VVTGVDTFRYYTIEGTELAETHTQMNNKDREITTKYSCHCWTSTEKLIVCTEAGEIIQCDSDGSYMCYIPESPTDEDFKIQAIIPNERGLIVAGNTSGSSNDDQKTAKVYVYENVEDEKICYRLISKDPIEVKMDANQVGSNMNFQLSSMCLNHSEDAIFFTTKSN